MVITDADVPSEGVIGGIINVAWTTTNQGSDTQYGDFSDRIYISDDEYLDESDIQVDDPVAVMTLKDELVLVGRAKMFYINWYFILGTQ